MMDDFEWDEAKRRSNLAKHGVDLPRAALIFEGPVLQRQDRREDYGEQRYISIGLIDDECIVLVWTPRGERRRLISAWKGGRDERRILEESITGRDPGDGAAR